MIKSRRNKLSESLRKRSRKFESTEHVIESMDDLIDFIDENYEMAGSVDDLRDWDSWSVTLFNGRINFMLNAHVDERDNQIYFGVDQLKDIVADPVYGWKDAAEAIIDELGTDPNEDEIEEAAYDAIDDYMASDDSYDPSFSFDGKLPMTENEVFSVISDGADSLERDRDRMMDDLISEINDILTNKTESMKFRHTSSKTSPRKALKEASVQSFTDWEYPVLKDVMSTFKDDIQWALSRALYSMKSNLPRLESDNESEVLRALADILDKADDMNKVKKALKRTSLGQRMW